MMISVYRARQYKITSSSSLQLLYVERCKDLQRVTEQNSIAARALKVRDRS